MRYVWDMCSVRYANNLLKNPATKRLSGKNQLIYLMFCKTEAPLEILDPVRLICKNPCEDFFLKTHQHPSHIYAVSAHWFPEASIGTTVYHVDVQKQLASATPFAPPGSHHATQTNI